MYGFVTFLLFLSVVALGILQFVTWSHVGILRRRIEDFETRTLVRLAENPVPETEAQPETASPAAARIAAKTTGRRVATIATDAAPPPLEPDETPAGRARAPEEPAPVPAARPGASFEDLVGGKLPIWAGGISLVFAGFFLVRFTIDAGLLGPGARSILATLFALLMIAASELGGRLPKVGEAFKAEPRVGQALAGAAIAILYGTLYMASEIYGLVQLPMSFILVVTVTALAFALALRQGPPTALMGLVGGFLAPWVAGMGTDTISVLLLYLAIFLAALYGLAVWRRWLWLLVLASGGGAIWSGVLLATASTALPLLGLFILFSGSAALLALYRFDDGADRWLVLARYVPIALALAQLAILLSRMEFSITGWIFYTALSALTIAIAWRDVRMMVAVIGALLISIITLAGAWQNNPGEPASIAASFGIALLFGGAGLAGMRKPGIEGRAWAQRALAAPTLSWAASVAGVLNAGSANWTIWGMLALLAAMPCAWTAWTWHHRNDDKTPLLQGSATSATAFLVGAALFCWIDSDWTASIFAIVALGVAAWARITQSTADQRVAILPIGMAMAATLVGSADFVSAIGASIAGEKILLPFLPTMADATRNTLLPSLLLLTITWPRTFSVEDKTRIACFGVGGAGLLAFFWLLAKQPAAISSPADFIRLGFAERAIFTQLLFAGGWFAFRRSKVHPLWPSLAVLGRSLTVLAAARFVWFDLLIFNPAVAAQSLGSVPIANLGTIHAMLTAGWLWLAARETAVKNPLIPQIASLSAVVVATLVTVRQAVQGNLITGGEIGTGENYLYSAGLLALSLIWLVRGLTGGARMLRLAGLSLLTAVTLKVFLIDAAALTGVLRILSFLGLGLALIGIGWAYGRVISLDKITKEG